MARLYTEECKPPLPGTRPFRRCQCENRGLPPHRCAFRTEFVLVRPMAHRPASSLTRGWGGGPLPLCSPCRAEYIEHGYQSIVPLAEHEEASHGSNYSPNLS